MIAVVIGANYHNKKADGMDKGLPWMIATVPFGIGCGFFFANILDFIMILVAPKLYLLEYFIK